MLLPQIRAMTHPILKGCKLRRSVLPLQEITCCQCEVRVRELTEVVGMAHRR